jgi:hypothetical protein
MDHSTSSTGGERLTFKAPSIYSAALVVGVIGIVAAFALALIFESVRRFYFAYLVSFAWFLSLSLGGLFFVILQHLTKAAWSVNVRRIPEWLAASMPILAMLAVPLAVPVLLHRADLYPWAESSKPHTAEVAAPEAAEAPAASGEAKPASAAEPPEEEEITGFKRVFLNPFFWLVRIAFYFVVWSGIGLWYWRQSLKQDQTGDDTITAEMQRRSPVAMIAFAVTLTGAAFDLLMSLDPSWSSTIFGVYYFAGCAIGVFATTILTVLVLQRLGYLRESVTVEHFHDLGKFLFGFTFFWGYIGFSQYMLIWYANLPEETRWYLHRGATTAKRSFGTTGLTVKELAPWSYVSIALLFGHLLIPFAGLMSRHVKRFPPVLAFWALWLLVFHWIDIFWIVMPEMQYGKFHFGVVEIAAFIGIGGIYLAFVLNRAGQGSVRALHDPRLQASLEFQNI